LAYNVARDGAAKNLVAAPPVPGQKRQTSGGEPHPLIHGVTVDAAPKAKKTFTGKIPLHDGMTAAQKDEVHPLANSAANILADAENFGKSRGEKA
jgi:hypothetical protein